MLVLVGVPSAATVFYNAVMRNHLTKVGGEAERAALRTTADRAKAELVDAKKARDAPVAVESAKALG